jgi:hypothetical protein
MDLPGTRSALRWARSPADRRDSHAQSHDHDEDGLSDVELRVRALSRMIEKAYADPAALAAIVETYETKIGPRNGARGHQELDGPGLCRWLNEDATARMSAEKSIIEFKAGAFGGEPRAAVNPA